MVDLTGALGFLKIFIRDSKIPFFFLFITGIFNFSPTIFLGKLGFLSFVKSFHIYIGLIFLVCFVWLLILLIDTIYMVVKAQIIYFLSIKRLKSRLKHLENDELPYIKGYKNSNIQYFEIYDGVAKKLELDGIIFRVSSVSNNNGGRLLSFAFSINPLAKKYLLKTIWRK